MDDARIIVQTHAQIIVLADTFNVVDAITMLMQADVQRPGSSAVSG
jgi:hypothetical protein